MAQHRQSRTEWHGVRESNDMPHTNGTEDHVTVGMRSPIRTHKHKRLRRLARTNEALYHAVRVILVLLCLSLLVSVLASYYISTKGKETNNHRDSDETDDIRSGSVFLSNVSWIGGTRVLDFGKGSLQRGQDSRYWDEDDRSRDEDYNEDVMERISGGSRNENVDKGADMDDDYDEFFDFHDGHVEEYDDGRNTVGGHSNFVLKPKDIVHKASLNSFDAKIKDGIVSENFKMASPLNKRPAHVAKPNAPRVSLINEQSIIKSPLETKTRSKRRKFSGLCEMKLLCSTLKLVEPPEFQKFVRFNLQYTELEEITLGLKNWVPRFAGHQSLEEREKSFLAHDQKINCGFVKGPEGFPSPGFDLTEDDTRYISRCHIAVISCIFGNSDRLRTPARKWVTGLSRKNVCFVMFIDEVTLQTLALEGRVPDGMGFIGFWKLVVVKNLPYDDMRRVGKIPKLLPHRLFPSARYSIWLDSKLRLQSDPLLILEYFLWRDGYEFAISNHYDRHCVWEEVERNKNLNKYNHTVIDQQFDFYQADGLQRFNASDPNKLLPSNVPEGSFIVREHTPMSNLFSCLWFNEVDRFTPRDQLSFAYTYQKLRRMNPDRPFHLNMFKDCERRRIAKLFRHRADENSTSHGKSSE